MPDRSFRRSDPRSDDRPVGNHRVLRNDRDAVADVVVDPVGLAGAHIVADAHTPSDPRVLVDDGVLDDAVGADPDTGPPLAREPFEVLRALVEVGSQEEAVADARALRDPAADADHRPLDVRLVDEGAFRDQGPTDLAGMDLRRREEAWIRVDGLPRVPEV